MNNMLLSRLFLVWSLEEKQSKEEPKKPANNKTHTEYNAIKKPVTDKSRDIDMGLLSFLLFC